MSQEHADDGTTPLRTGEPRALRIIDGVGTAAMYLGIAAITLLTVTVVVDVVGRAFFSSPLPGTLELTTYWWMPALTVLPFAFTERVQEHIKVTLLLDNLPLRFRRIGEGSFGILVTAIVAALAYFALVNALHGAEIGEATQSTPPIPIWPAKFVVFAGLLALTLQTAASAYRFFTGRLPRYEADETEGRVL